MTTSYFQGGDFVELLSAQGKAPAAQWKLQGKVTKSFEKLIKGNAFLLDGSADTRMQLPKGGGSAGSSANAVASLGLTQRFLVLQLLVPFTKSFSLEIGFSDHQRARRRFVISSAFREPTVTALHAQIPLGAAAVSRDAWINLVLDLQALTDSYFAGSVFRSMESLAIAGSCRLKRVFTMKDPPTPSGCVGGNNTADIPRQFVFSSGKEGMPAPTEYFVMQAQCGGAGDIKPASDAVAKERRAGSASSGLVKGRSVAGSERRATPDPKKKSNGSGLEGGKRPEEGASRGGRPAALTRGAPNAGGASQEREETSEVATKKEPAPLRAAKAAPREARKVQEARASTPTPSLVDKPDLQPPRLQTPATSGADSKASPGRDWCRPRTARDLTGCPPDVRPASAASTRSNMSSRSSASRERRSVIASDDELAEVATEKSVQALNGPLSRPASSRGDRFNRSSRQEIMSEIKQKLELIADEDERATNRSQELFLRHTTLTDHLDLDLDESSAANAQPSRDTQSVDDRGSLSRRSATSTSGLGAAQKPKESIFAFSSRSSSIDAAPSCTSSVSRLQEGEMVTIPAVRSKLFDFDALLDAVDLPAITTDTSAAAATDSPMESSSRLEPVNLEVEGEAEEDADSGSDHELEQLLAAKRAARCQEQQQQRDRQVRRSATASVDGGLKSSRNDLGSGQLAEASSMGVGDKQRASAAMWSFSGQASAACDAEGVTGDGSDVVGEREDDGYGDDGGDEDDEGQDNDDNNDEDDDDLSIDLTGELDDLDQVDKGVGEADAPSPSLSDDRAAPGATHSPRQVSMTTETPGMIASRASALSTSFDFGDLMEDGEGGDQASSVEKQAAQAHPSVQPAASPLESSTLPPIAANLDFAVMDSSQSPAATASPVAAGESSTAKRLQRLLESTEWRSLATPTPERRSQKCQASSSTFPPPSASLELVYDPVLRCYYDPVADKYYALAE